MYHCALLGLQACRLQLNGSNEHHDQITHLARQGLTTDVGDDSLLALLRHYLVAQRLEQKMSTRARDTTA